MAKAFVTGSLISLTLAGALVAPAGAARAESFVVEGSKAAGLQSCVEPTEAMRRFHMELIEHQRDATVHEGIRATKHSLSGCIDCHVSYQDGRPVPVDAPGQFCANCHEFAAVSLNCFDCHATVPTEPKLSSAFQERGASPAGWGASSEPGTAVLAAGHEGPVGLPWVLQGEGDRP